MHIRKGGTVKKTTHSFIPIFLYLAVFTLPLYPNQITEQAKSNFRIMVGPNILVSRDGEVPHVELMISSNPKNPKNLVGAAITFTRPDGRTACKTYTSLDGGYTWIDSSFAEQIQYKEGGFDPQVAYGLNGTAYFCALANFRDNKGNVQSALHFYRSEDGGISWKKKTDLGSSYDHQQLVVDHSYGRYAGRVYIGTQYRKFPRDYTLGIFRSDDDGKTFVGPVDFASGSGERVLSCANVLILSDGSLFVPYLESSFDPNRTTQAFWFVVSKDGGVTFSSPKKILVQQYERLKARLKGSFVRPDGYAMFAVDKHSDNYKDHLYVVWSDVRFGKPRLLFSFSKDRGHSWIKPKLICPEVPEWASQYQPMIFVNGKSVLGIMWFDTRASIKNDRYHLYFTASLDGGESFLPAVQVSSAPSFPVSEINLTPSPLFGIHSDKSINIRTLSAYTRWGNGGDYMGLTATADDIFHPFWADSRGKCFQIWTCQVVVKSEEDSKAQTDKKESSRKEKVILNNKMDLVYDPIIYDPATQVAIFPVRLKNISKESLYGPFSVKIKTLYQEVLKKYYEEEELANIIPEILNASNREKGAGALFDYSATLRDFESLGPGALTEPVEWKLRFPNLLKADLNLEVEITGFVIQKNEAQ